MKIAHLTPGTGSFYCGSCLRDHTLVLALRALGHDVWMVPMYLPFVLEEHAPELEQRVWMGGINSYLQNRSQWFARLPAFLRRWLDSPSLLRWASSKGDLTDIAAHCEMTLSMLSGENGRLVLEVDELVEGLLSERPDVVCLSNILMIGVVRRLKSRLDRPIVCSLQGEVPFVKLMPEPWRSKAIALIAERAQEVDAFVAVSRSYADCSIDAFQLPPDRVQVVYNGIDLEPFRGLEARADSPALSSDARRPPAIGFLARMCRDKGIHTLVDAFVLLREQGRVPGLKLKAAGVVLKADRPLLRELERKLISRGLRGDVELLPNVSRERKVEVLRSIDVLSVPATYGESFGLYLLEAWALGVPCVEPRHGAFPELLEITGGGRLCEPDDPRSLADELEKLLLDPEAARRLGAHARSIVEDRFTSREMARGFVGVLQSLRSAPPVSVLSPRS